MITNFEINDFNSSEKNDKLSLYCEYCGKHFDKKKKSIEKAMKKPTSDSLRYCSLTCKAKHYLYKLILEKKPTNHLFPKNPQPKKNRSKLEVYLEEMIVKYYPNLKIIFDDSSIIGYNLDIYIPSLSTAIEINGIHNYKPIFGDKNLQKIQNINKNKIVECRKKGIKLYMINASDQHKFTVESSQKYLNDIITIINHELYK